MVVECVGLVSRMSTYKCPLRECVRGMLRLERDRFQATLSVPFVRVHSHNISRILPFLKKRKWLLAVPRMKNVAVDAEDKTKRCVLLDPTVDTDLLQELIDDATKQQISVDIGDKHDVQLTFDNFTYQQILRAVLPEDVPVPSGFSSIGNIVHMNLDEGHLPYKQLIGETLLAKVPQCTIVVNKIESIGNEYRTFQMEILAVKDGCSSSLETEVKENGCRFRMDFQKVFWNPRLSAEHERMVASLPRQCVVYDVFAGIGPFSIPAVKLRDCVVIANDLNPDSVHYLKVNSKLNRVQCASVSNLDGGAFIRTVLADDLTKRLTTKDADCEAHVLMNLPALAPTFLPNFVGLLTDRLPESIPSESGELPFPFWVHCYLFVKGTDDFSDGATQAILNQFHKFNLERDQLIALSVRSVRNVAPYKEMMLASFRPSIRLLTTNTLEPHCKRPKVDSKDSL